MTAPERPSFIVVGPPRTGTSWLHKILEPYATLPSPSKETRFFDLHFHRGFDWYAWHFPRHRSGPMGEVAPTYFGSPEARLRIAETLPGAKIVLIFRDPIERAVSLYRLKLAYGMLRCSFAEALREDEELINSGLYWTHLCGWRDCFPDEQLLVMIYDDLASNPQKFANRVAAFVGLPPIELSQAQVRRVYSSERMNQPRSYLATSTATAFANWCKARHLDHLVASVRESALIKLFLGGGKSLPSVDSETLDVLSDRFRPEVKALASHLGRRLESWNSIRMPHEDRAQDEENGARSLVGTKYSAF